jgi:hypothetical protein
LYLVADHAASRLQRDVRSYFRWACPVVVLLLIGIQRRWGWPIVTLLGIAGGVAFRFWLARGLPRITRTESNLLPVDRRQQCAAMARATGAPTLWVMLIVGSFGSLISIVGAWYLPTPEGWLVSGLMGLFTVLFGWQLHLLRTVTRSTNHSRG